MVKKQISAPFDDIGLRIPYRELKSLLAIAEGGFGVVYQGTHSTYGDIAYKELKATVIALEDSNELMREAQLLLLDRHPNIVILHAVTFEPQHYGFVFEFVKFGGLDGFIRKYKVDWPMKLRIAHGVVQGMTYLHGRQPPVIHGDLKVQNVLIGSEFCAKVCDFGLSKWKQFSSERTGCKSVRGTVTHIPPENWRSINEPRTVKFDVYSFSIFLWELMTQMRPFEQANEEQIKLAVKDGEHPDMRNFTEPKFAVECITWCWHHAPDKRPTFAVLEVEFNNFLKRRKTSVSIARRCLQKQMTVPHLRIQSATEPPAHVFTSLKTLIYHRDEHSQSEPPSHRCMSSKVLVYRRREIRQDIHSLPLELHEMMLMSSLYRLTTTLLPIDARYDPRLPIKVETRAHVVAFKSLSSVCQHFHQVITKRRWFRRLLKTLLTAACRPFRLQPRLLQTLDTCHRDWVTGLTKLVNRLYIVYNKSDTISVYNCEQQPFIQLRSIHVNEMKFPIGIAASVNSNCLYVSDQDSCCVWRVRADHKVDKWIDVVKAESLSVTLEGHVVILVPTDVQGSEVNRAWRGRIEVYGVDKLKLNVLKLPHDVVNPRYVVQTADKTFIVCHGDRTATLNRVVVVNNEGYIVMSHGGPGGNGMRQLYAPCQIALDADERVFVADTFNSRVLLLNRKLNLERVLLTWSRADNVHWPVRLHYDRETSQLAVGLYTGHVEIYNL